MRPMIRLRPLPVTSAAMRRAVVRAPSILPARACARAMLWSARTRLYQ